MRVLGRSTARPRTIAKGIHQIGQLASRFNNSEIGSLAGTFVPTVGALARGVERYAPKVSNLIEKGADIYDKINPDLMDFKNEAKNINNSLLLDYGN